MRTGFCVLWMTMAMGVAAVVAGEADFPDCLALKDFEQFVQAVCGPPVGMISPFGSHFGQWYCQGHPELAGAGQLRILGQRQVFSPVNLMLVDDSGTTAHFGIGPASRTWTFYPHLAMMTAIQADVGVEVRTLFADCDRLQVEARVVTGAAPGLRWLVHGTLPWSATDSLRTVTGGVAGYHGRERLAVQIPGATAEAVLIKYPTQALEMSPAQLPSATEPTGYWLDAGPVTEAPLVVKLEYYPTSILDASAPPSDNWLKTADDQAEAQVRQRWDQLLAKVPWPASRELWPVHAKALYTLETIRYRGYPGSAAEGYVASLPSKSHYIGHWLWDSAFHALGYALYDPATAQDQLRLLIKYQDTKTGLIPNYIPLPGTAESGGTMDRSQPPVLAWTALEIHRHQPDVAFLREVYPALVKFHDFYSSPLRDTNGDGLMEWGSSGATLNDQLAKFESGWDTSPRWDEGCHVYNALDLNCWLASERACLAAIATEIGHATENMMWTFRYHQLLERIENILWSEELGAYVDHHKQLKQLSSILTPASFMPLMVASAQVERASRLVAEHLRNPERFWPRLPSVSMEHPDYKPADYWRGPTWINLMYFTMLGLRRAGYEQEYEHFRQLMIELAAGSNHLGEYYNSQTGESIGAQQYGWTAAFVMRTTLGLDAQLPELEPRQW